MRINFNVFDSGGFLDKTGAVFSWICAVHCIAPPFLVSVLPIVGLSFVGSEFAEYAFLSISVVVGALSLVPAYFRRHRQLRTILLFSTGIGLIILADALFEENITGKSLFLAAGAVAISVSHIINRKLCKNCNVCGEAESHSLS